MTAVYSDEQALGRSVAGRGMCRRARHTRLRLLCLRAGVRQHERATHRCIGERLAALLGCTFDGELGPSAAGSQAAYLVPDETITSQDNARRFGIQDEEDLFGGVVPSAFVATKTITHSLIDERAVAPVGWRPEFAQRVARAVLPGYSAFSLDDARAAGQRLLLQGAVRIKAAEGIGGSGQSVARDEAEMDAGLAALDADGLADQGVVIERDVPDARTYSIGQLRVAGLRASYFGTQRTTPNRDGQAVYGGSSISVVRGCFEALERFTRADADVSRAVALARTYHGAAMQCFTGMFASRCNYDVIQGHGPGGEPLIGVLEQSWRIGGASGAEVLALQALHDDPTLAVVHASTFEVHGRLTDPPAGAMVIFAGIDPHVGPIMKYAQIDHHADA